MAKKNRETHAAPPSSAETDSDSSSSSSEGDELPSTPPPPSAADKKPAAQKKPAEAAAQEATDSESDSDDSDSSVKPNASKPMDDSSKLRKPRSKTNYKPSNPAASPSMTPAKRAPTVEEEKDMKKPKKEKREGGAEEEGKKSTLFQRLWSDDDEIVILKGILEYKEKKGTYPMADANDFHDFIKSSLHINVDRSQMVSKVRRLKKRYVNSVAKKKTFSAHERNAFELSEKIWGSTGQSANADPQTKGNLKSTAAAGQSVGSTGMVSTVAINGAMASPSEMKDGGVSGSSQEVVENSYHFIGKASISMGLDENIVKMGLGLCKEDKKAEIEEKWKQLHLEESKLWLRKLDLAREESKMVIEALKSGGN